MGSIYYDGMTRIDQTGDAPTARRGENADCATRYNPPRASESKDAF